MNTNSKKNETINIVGNIVTSLRKQYENHTVTGTLADAVWKYQQAVYAEAEAAQAKADADAEAQAKAKAEVAVKTAKEARAKADKAKADAKAQATDAKKARKEVRAKVKAKLHVSSKAVAVKATKKVVITASNELRLNSKAIEAIKLDNEAMFAEHQAEIAVEAAKAEAKGKGHPTPKNSKHRPGKMPKLILSDKLVAVFKRALDRTPVDGDKSDFLIAHAIWNRIKGCQAALSADADSKDSRCLESLDSGTIAGIAECIQLMTGKTPDEGRLISWIRERSFEFLSPWFKDQARFKKSTFASAKVDYNDLVWGSGIATFSDDKAMPIQLAESEVSRICKRDGRKLLTIAMGNVELPEKWSLFVFKDLFVKDEERDLLRRFYSIIHDGIRTADGKRYMFVSQSAGATRNAEVTLISVDESKADSSEGLWKAEVLPVWVELTGLSWAEMQRQLMDIDDNGVVWFNAAKFTARLAVNGSDTKTLAELCPEIDRKVRAWNVARCTDPGTRCERPNIHAVNGQLVMDESGHDIVVGDGQAILSFQAVSHLNAAIGVPLYEAERFAALEREISVRACDKLEDVDGKLRIKADMTNLTKDEVMNVILALRDDKEFARLASRMSYAFQTRRQHAVEKGAMFGTYTCCMPMHDGFLADAAIPDSFVKANGSAWSDGSLMICNYLNNKKRYVSMSSQFLNSLMFKNPNELNPVVDYWAGEIAKVFEVETIEEVDPITGVSSKSSRPTADARKTAMALLNVIGDGNEDDSLVPMALKANSELMLDHHVQASMSRAFEKLYKEMLSGRIMVPGVYTYQACDMLAVLNKAFEKEGLDNPELESGTAYFNGFAGTVSTFRSPMTAPAQAVNCQCVPVDTYWYTKDLFIDNAKDGAWDRRAGSDYDGDTVAVVTKAATLPNGFEVGKVITEAVKDFGYDLCEDKHSARKVEWSYDNFAFEMCKGIHRDQTGIITNTNTKCWEVYHHLRGLVSHMLTHGLSKVEFYLPTDNLCGRNLSKDDDCFEKKWVGHGLDLSLASQGILRAPGLKQRKVSKDGKTEWISSDLDIVGTYDLQGIKELAMKWHDLGKLTCLFQGIEIDGGKTNYYAVDHGYSKEKHDVKLCTPQMMCRSMLKGRDISATARRNTFFSCSMVASLYERALGHYRAFLDTRKQSEKILTSYMNSLLSADELKVLYYKPNGGLKMWSNADQAYKVYEDFVSYVEDRKAAYNTQIRDLRKTIKDSEECIKAIAALKEREVSEVVSTDENGHRFEGLLAYVGSNIYGVKTTIEMIAAACYAAAYRKASNMKSGTGYAFILSDDIISVFSRGNDQAQLFRLGTFGEQAEVVNNSLYVDGRAVKKNMKAADGLCEIVEMRGYRYALVHINKPAINDNAEAPVIDLPEELPMVGITGIKYCFDSENPVDEAIKALEASNWEMSVVLGKDNRPNCYAGNVRIGILTATGKDSGYELFVGHSFRIVNYGQLKKTKASINGIKVKAIK